MSATMQIRVTRARCIDALIVALLAAPGSASPPKPSEILPVAESPIANMTPAEMEAWTEESKRPDSAHPWPPPWMAELSRQLERLNELEILPSNRILKTPEHAHRLVQEFYLDWNDAHANSHWQGGLFYMLEIMKPSDGPTADALAAGLLQVYAEGGGLATPAHISCMAKVFQSIDAPRYPELRGIAEDLFDEAEEWAVSNGQDFAVEAIRRSRSSPPQWPGPDPASTERQNDLPTPQPTSAPSLASAPADWKGDIAERIQRLGRASKLDPVAWAQVFEDARSALSKLNPASRGPLRELVATRVALKWRKSLDADACEPVEQWLLAIASTPQLSQSPQVARAWARCAVTLESSASARFRRQVAEMADRSQNETWAHALRTFLRRSQPKQAVANTPQPQADKQPAPAPAIPR